MTLDENKLNAFVGKMVGDLGAALSGALVVLGDRLGLYRGLAEGPATSEELAKRSGANERYVREWLNAQASAGYVSYDAASRRYTLPAEHAFVLADPSSPAYFPGAFQIAQAGWNGIPKIESNFKTGEGLAWGAQHPCLFEGTERFFRAGYVANLLSSWIPALTGVEEKLKRGARVADVGCGLGASSILMARAFPNSRFYGFDSHQGSIELARQRAKDAGVEDRVSFQVANATDFPGNTYDLVAHFDCLHDMEDPVGAAKQVKRALAPDGTWMVVEPFASDRAEDNHNAVGRVFYSASTMLCVPHSLSCGGPALGAQAGEARLRQIVVEGARFTRFRRATQTPFNLVLEARP
jgi:2-polyprenyl-3-methyl-5-hydroxy-6-metoxy-1,4-benzoquinol methylase